MQAFAQAGHPVYFVDPEEPAIRIADGVTIVPTLADTPRSGVILYAHFAPVRTMFERFDDPVVVYDILDDLSIFDADEVGVPEERRVRTHHAPLVQSADVVTASAPLLVDKHKAERPDILFLENGVDAARFAPDGTAAAALDTIDRPIVGYHGMVSRWFDFDLMTQVAQARPDVSFVIVGPVDPGSKEPADRLSAHANVTFLGPRPSGHMPEFVRSFDVGLVPFVVDDMTKAVSPLKMYEYLAAGVPVVTTPLPVCVDHPLVATASEPAEFAALIDEAIASADAESKAARVAAGMDADWGARLKPLRERLATIDRLRVPT